MKGINKVPGFASIESDLASAYELETESMFIKIKAAKKIAGKLLAIITDEEAKKMLNLPETYEENQKLYNPLSEKPQMSFLEAMVFIGINQSQNLNDGRVLSALVSINRTAAQNAGFKTIDKLYPLFDKINSDTAGFIDIDKGAKSTTQSIFCFSFFCDFTKEFPVKQTV